MLFKRKSWANMMPEFLFLFPGIRSGSGFIPARLPDFSVLTLFPILFYREKICV